MKEKLILKKFFSELQQINGSVTYGLEDVLKALEMGAVEIIILSESLTINEYEYECECGMSKKFVEKDKRDKQKCKQCGQVFKILGEKDVFEAFEELVKNYGAKVEMVSNETREGKQFEELGGIGAILRYRIE